jgi:hypothetical protein
LLPEVLKITGYDELSLNAKLGGKNAEFIDIKNDVITSTDHFLAMWMKGMIRYLEKQGERKYTSAVYELQQCIKDYEVVRQYAFTFLERMYLRNYEALSKERPKVEESTMWIGQQNASYGILITPRFRNGNWENDNSEIRHFKKPYWTIGHILETGLAIPFENDAQEFGDVDDYLGFFKNYIGKSLRL